MRALITGMSGTIGSRLAAALRTHGHEPVGYVRGDEPIDDPEVVERRLRDAQPDVLFHLATASQPTGLENEGWRVNVEWSTCLAEECDKLGVRIVFTSTALVFSDSARGPFTPESRPDVEHGYGYEKRVAEQRVRSANADAVVVRIGWQIGDAPGGNQMLSYLEQKHREEGVVRASRKWLPACSFLDDTASMLIRLASAPPGLYHWDSNRHWSFYEIACALNERAGGRWKIVADDAFEFDQRLLDPRVQGPALFQRLPGCRQECSGGGEAGLA